MIRKIKTGVNGFSGNDYSDGNESKKNHVASYDVDSKNAQLEELDLSTYTADNSSMSHTVINEDTVLNAIHENFNTNRTITNEMNKGIYDSVMEKISSYVSSNNGGGM